MCDGDRSLPRIPQAAPGAFYEEHREETTAAIARVLDSGVYILGDEVKAFEHEFARQLGFDDAVGVASGTDAVFLALRALGVGPGDLVATVSHTAVATVAAIEMAGARPLFVDISADTYLMDPEALTRTLKTTDSVKAVVVVHLYGQMADVPAIARIASRYGIRVIEDCAQAAGARLDGHYAGKMADIAAFSFYPTKNLGAIGDAGMVAADDRGWMSKVRALSQYGWGPDRISRQPGINSRLDELQAAVLRVSLPYLGAGNRRRASIAAAYDRGLADTGLILPVRRSGATHVFHQYVVRHPDRNRLRDHLNQKGIDTNIHYPVPVHRQPAYAGRCRIDPGGLGVTDAVAREVLSLPIYPELSDAAVERIIDAIASFRGSVITSAPQ